MFPDKKEFLNLTKNSAIDLAKSIAEFYLSKSFLGIIDSREIVNCYGIDIFSADFTNQDIAGYTKDNKIVINNELTGKEYNFIILKELYQNLSETYKLDNYRVSMRNYKLSNQADIFSAICLIQNSKKYFDMADNYEISNVSLMPEEIVSILRYSQGDL